MTNTATTDEATAERLERRWFAALKAASAARSECEDLLEVIERARSDWRAARRRLPAPQPPRAARGQPRAARAPERDARARGDRADPDDGIGREVQSAA